METVFSINNVILGIISALVVFFGKNYLVPFIKVEKNRRYAELIARLADEITDDLMARYPDKEWLKFLDEAVDKLIKVCDINKVIAARAVNSALQRKHIAQI